MIVTNDCPCRRQLAGFRASEEDPVVLTAANAAAQRSDGVSALRSIGIGVATGLTVWFLTRFIDGGRRRSRR